MPLILPLLLLLPAADAPSPAAVAFFETKVRPVLVEHCHGCHSPKKKRGGLLLDSRANLLKGGDTGPAVAPGDPDKSLLVRAVSYKDDLRMPPRSKLSDQQIADLTAWVRMGAPWPGASTAAGEEKIDFRKRLEHWSFQPVRAAAVPAVEAAAWPRNPVDRFVLAKLEQARLTPAAEADRRTLIRRLTFDLTGLPPTPADVRAFVADDRPDAYERLVDTLLSSPAYGERWGRHWLDLVRYAETCGHEFDFDIPHAHGYRDYVLRALNADLPYDALVREHLAGDLIAHPRRHPATGTNESVLGTGFWLLGEAKHSPVDLRSDGADRRDNMIDVFGKAFLGMTIACARCHDHKFDPITTKEYYSLVSYLQSSRPQRAFLDPPERIAGPAARLRDLRRAAADFAVARAVRELEATPGEMPAVVGDREGDASLPDFREWFATGDAFMTALGDRDVEIDPAAVVPVRRLLRGASSGAASARLAGALRSPTFTLTKKYLHYRARGTGVRVNLILDGFHQIRDPIYGGLTFAVNSAEPRWYTQNLTMWVGLSGYVEVLDDGDGAVELERVVCSDHPTPPPEPTGALVRQLVERSGSLDAARKGYPQLVRECLHAWRDDKATADQLALVDTILRGTSPRPASPDAELAKRMKQIANLEQSLPRPTRGLALTDGNGVVDRVHIRGNPKTLGEAAPRQPPAVVGTSAGPPSPGSGRLELAGRLTAPDNPLFARVIVNRLWHHHFGHGLVRSTDDFGHQGDRPTHPELLDWLATELARGGWRLKPLHRLLVTSATYRMGSRDEAGDRADPTNQLLHRMPIRRLEAEAVRDSILAASGRLDRRMFGPGPAPHLTDFMIGRGRPGQSGPLDGDGRRSVYLTVRRNFLDPFFLAFDYPTPFTTIGRRSVSNVPAQALAMLNHPFVTQQSKLWAQAVLAVPGRGDDERITAMYETAFGRPPTAAERAQALGFLDDQAREYGRRDARVWEDLAHVLLNGKEFLFVS